MEMRGLSVFISDIRKSASQSKEAEQQRIEKELHKIRQKFKETKNLKGYDRKKMVCKLLYIYMLGYEVDFGHMEAVQLLSSDKYSEKHVGYLACTLFLNEKDELLTLITHSVKQDLTCNTSASRQFRSSSAQDTQFTQCLALTAIANIGGKDFADTMTDDVRRVAFSRESAPFVKKKAMLTLLRLYRASPEKLEVEEIADQVVEELGHMNFGYSNSVLSLVLGLLGKHTVAFAGAVARCISLMSVIVMNGGTWPEYVYYGIPAPWIQIKCLRILQHYPMPTGTLAQQITSILTKIITSSERILREQHQQKARAAPARSHAMNAVLAEAINLVIHWDNNKSLLSLSSSILGRFITENKDANLRYLGLDLLARLSFCGEVFSETISKHQLTIVMSLKDLDISIRRKALDLLYVMCDRSNASEIVGELLEYLSVAEINIKAELVLKIAILAEKFSVDFEWYVDVILNIISQAGDFVSQDVWQRVIQVVTNNEGVQKHAVDIVFKAVNTPAAHEVVIKVASHLLGEFGYLIQDAPESSPLAQFQVLHSKFGLVTNETKALLLNCYVKFYNLYPDCTPLKEKIKKVFHDNRNHMDVEIQQRATEYSVLINPEYVSDDIVQTVLESMPQYTNETCRMMETLIKKGEDTADQNVWQQKQEDKERDMQEERRREMESKEGALDRWRRFVELVGFFAKDDNTLLQHSAWKKASEGKWTQINTLLPWEQLFGQIYGQAATEAAKLNPPMHPDYVLSQMVETEILYCKEMLRERTREPFSLGTYQTMDEAENTLRVINAVPDENPYTYNSSNLFGLGHTPELIDQAIREVDQEANRRLQALATSFPNRNKEAHEAPAATPATASKPGADLDSIFGLGDSQPPSQPSIPQQPQPPSQQPSGIGSLDDIFGSGPSSQPTPQPQQQQQHVDPFGWQAPAAAAPTSQQPWKDDAAEAAMQQKHLDLIANPRGVLYEDPRIQIGVHTEYHGCEGRVLLFLGNKTSDKLDGLRFEASSLPNLQLNQQPLDGEIAPRAQVQLMLMLKCLDYYEHWPSGTLSFTLEGRPARISLPLPIPATKFMEPLKLQAGQQFFQAWQATQGTQNPPAWQIYRCQNAINLDACQKTLETALRLHVLRAVDNNQNNMVGSGYFTPVGWTTAPPPKSQYVVLVNLETNPQAKAVRVTVKTPLASIEKDVQGVLKRCFEMM